MITFTSTCHVLSNAYTLLPMFLYFWSQKIFAMTYGETDVILYMIFIITDTLTIL
jgi:hypothetical protein